MEKYIKNRKKLCRRLTALSFTALIIYILAFAFADKYFMIYSTDAERGIASNPILLLLIFTLISLISYFDIIIKSHNKKKIKQYYIEETDERSRTIFTQALSTSMKISGIALFAAYLITNIVNPTIGDILEKVVCGLVLLIAGTYYYYRKKM